MIPALFVSHGAPTLALEPGMVGTVWRELVSTFAQPKSVLVISAHWETPSPQVSRADPPKTIHDFGGFPDALYQIQYPAQGAPELADRVGTLLSDAGLVTQQNPNRGLDHGAWVPLRSMYPDAKIRVTQLSLQTRMGTQYAHAVGQALKPLRDEGVLILASGGIVHNLRELNWRGEGKPALWATEFNDWMAAHVVTHDIDMLLNYRRRAPHAAQNHPTEEHLMPFFVALGAASLDAPTQRIPLGFTYGSLGMDAYVFN